MMEVPRIPPELEAEMTPAVRAFVEMLLRIIGDQQRTIESQQREIDELRGRLGMTPRNSSKPPASEHPHARPAPRPKPNAGKKKPGGQPGHKKAERALVPPERVNKTIPCKPKACRSCGERLAGEDSQPLRHQVWELPEIQPIITEYQRHRLL
jgi:transposase